MKRYCYFFLLSLFLLLFQKAVCGSFREDFDAAFQARQEKDFFRAESILKKSIEQLGGRYELYNLLGWVFLDREQYEDARDSFLQALSLSPAHANSHQGLGCALIKLRQFSEAKTAFTRALAFDREDTVSMIKMLEISDALSDAELSRAYCDMLEPSARNEYTRYILGIYREKGGEYEKAAALLKSLSEEFQDNPVYAKDYFRMRFENFLITGNCI